MEEPNVDGHAPRTASTPTRATRIVRRLGTTARTAATVPTLVHQARRVSRDVPRLPEAAGAHGIATTVCQDSERASTEPSLDPDSPHAYHLVVLGDSVAAGVGLDHHRNSVAGRLASSLSERCGHPVAWHVIARSGADARECLAFVHDPETAHRLTTCDALVVSVGVNDLLGRHTTTAWRRDLSALLTHLVTLNPDAPIILLGVPPIDAFPAMPAELGAALGRRARLFDDVGIDVVGHLPSVHHLLLADPDLTTEKAFADDGFHPSRKMHKRIAKRADKLMRDARRHPDVTRLTRECDGDAAALRGA